MESLHTPDREQLARQMGFIWDVYPRTSTDERVARGHSSRQENAMAMVEEALRQEDAAAWGVVITPWGKTDICRRGRGDDFVWRPLFPDGYPSTEAPFEGLQPTDSRG